MRVSPAAAITRPRLQARACPSCGWPGVPAPRIPSRSSDRDASRRDASLIEDAAVEQAFATNSAFLHDRIVAPDLALLHRLRRAAAVQRDHRIPASCETMRSSMKRATSARCSAGMSGCPPITAASEHGLQGLHLPPDSGRATTRGRPSIMQATRVHVVDLGGEQVSRCCRDIGEHRHRASPSRRGPSCSRPRRRTPQA